jgi:hypothetical protein
VSRYINKDHKDIFALLYKDFTGRSLVHSKSGVTTVNNSSVGRGVVKRTPESISSNVLPKVKLQKTRSPAVSEMAHAHEMTHLLFALGWASLRNKVAEQLVHAKT